MNKTRIVIAGASFGGINAAYRLRQLMGPRADITIVSKEDNFTFFPSLPWVVFGWRRPETVTIPLREPLRRKGFNFIHATVERVDPQAGKVFTAQGEIPYDYLIVATGPDLDYAALPGLGPYEGHTESIFSTSEAVRARDALAKLLSQERGRVVVGAAPGASCIGPGYEVVMILDAVLRRRRKRHQFSLSFVCPEPFLGHFGVGGIGNVQRLMEGEFAERHIETIMNAQITQIDAGRIVLADGNEVAFDFALVIPAFKGVQAVRESDGLANPKGFVPVTPYLSSAQHPNIYAVGVAIALAPPGPTPVPVGVPKTGQMTELMAQVAAHNIAADIKGTAKRDGLTLPVTCIADAGDTAFYIFADPFLPPRNKVVHKKGKWARYMKVMFEKYYLRRIRYGLPSLHFGW